jgi:hypothetical protein
VELGECSLQNMETVTEPKTTGTSTSCAQSRVPTGNCDVRRRLSVAFDSNMGLIWLCRGRKYWLILLGTAKRYKVVR